MAAIHNCCYTVGGLHHCAKLYWNWCTVSLTSKLYYFVSLPW